MPRPLRRFPRARPRLEVEAPAGPGDTPCDTRGVRPEGVVVLLHGGPTRGFRATNRWNLAYLQMLPFGRAIRRLAGDRIAVVRLRHRQSGWNGPQATVVAEARWALADVERRFPGVPVALVGHSLGGRTALALGGDPRVDDVVALAPWLPPGEPVGHLAGRELLVVHGRWDLVCPIRDTDAWVDRARAAGAAVRYVRLPHTGHSLLPGIRRCHAEVARYVVDRLLPT